MLVGSSQVGGVSPGSLLELIEPLPSVKWVHFHCADGYYESLSLDSLLDERTILVYRMNDQILPDIYGAPLRLIVPPLYGYKNPKAIVRLVFRRGRAAWLLANSRTLQPGRYHTIRS